MDSSRRAPSPTPSVGSSSGSNVNPSQGMQNYPHPGSLPHPYPPPPPSHPGQHPMYPMPPHHMPPHQPLMHPPHLPPSSHMLSQLFPNLNMQSNGRAPSALPPNAGSRLGYSGSDPELTTSDHHTQGEMNSMSIPALMRPVSASVSTNSIPPPPVPPIRSASISSPGVVRPGTRLAGQNPVYEPKMDPDTRSLEVTPITLYVSERASDLGTLISINDKFISYPIRNGLIRVINQSSVNRILLRKHEQHAVTELSFFNDHTDLLLSAGTDNHIVVWRLTGDITREVVKTMPVRSQRVKWHPLDSNKIAIVQDNAAFVTDLTYDDDSAFDLHASSVVCSQSHARINDATFTADGQSLITAGKDGLVHIYRVGHLGPGDDGEFVRSFNPLDGVPLNSLHLYDGNFGNMEAGLLIGAQGNTILSLWNTPVDEATEPQSYQTVRINSTHQHELVLDASKQYVYVADRAHAVLYVLHLATSGSNRVPRLLDHITEFSLAYPILSMTVLNKADRSDDGGLIMQLYCIQTQAIQRYHVNSTACYIPPPRGAPLPPTNEAQTVGAMTTEEETSTYQQSAAESPRAVGSAASPETELDISIAVHDFNGSEEGLSSMMATDGGGGSVGGRSDDQQDMDSMIMQQRISSSPRSVSSLPMPPPVSSKEHNAYSPTSSSVHNAFMDDSQSVQDETNVLGLLRRMEMQQREHHEQMKEQYAMLAAQMNAQMDKSIKKHMQAVIVPAMGRIVMHTMENNFMKPVQKAIQETLEANLTSDAHSAAATTQVAQAVQQPVRDAFRDCFQSHIIPSFQAATQKMFEQIQDTFVKGTRAKVIESNDGLQEFQTQLAHVTQLMHQVTDQLAHGGLAAAAVPQESTFDAQCRAIAELLDDRKYEEGFQLALGAENVALVRAACQQVDPQAVLGSRPPHLSQMIVLCLVQQLGSDVLNLEHLTLNLKWLRESLLVMNPKDPAISPFVQNVMHELKLTLGEVPDEARDSQYTLVHHILNSMLSFA
ncbi:Aste57867_10040 [Aphanomyces stellatus]|uniref:Aste57867_10040 protein n=1 Tax=Aphanomyces stellatus TaxID=120398 RepID=A0A485KQ04_9STRA|nr:hypothetical protein As57867_010001 [Aphanomyces stellatus]VFT86917.1 Aste57867_10040 [Aphanomyces stellatus]